MTTSRRRSDVRAVKTAWPLGKDVANGAPVSSSLDRQRRLLQLCNSCAYRGVERRHQEEGRGNPASPARARFPVQSNQRQRPRESVNPPNGRQALPVQRDAARAPLVARYIEEHYRPDGRAGVWLVGRRRADARPGRSPRLHGAGIGSGPGGPIVESPRFVLIPCQTCSATTVVLGDKRRPKQCARCRTPVRPGLRQLLPLRRVRRRPSTTARRRFGRSPLDSRKASRPAG